MGVSFALHGPVFKWTKTNTGYNEVSLHLVGDKILLYRQSEGEWALFDLNWNKVAVLKDTEDFARIHALNVHRLGKNPEHYSGYGDGRSPRCGLPYGTCAAELERYTLGASTTEMLCPNENCDEGNLGQCIYDSKTKKLICGSSGSGNKIYLLDPEAKTFSKWPARGAKWASHFETEVIAIYNNYVYIAITPYPGNLTFPPNTVTKLYRIKIDDFYANFGKGAIEDYAEYVMDLGTNMFYTREGFIYGKRVHLWRGVLDLDKLSVTSFRPTKRYLGTKYSLDYENNAVIDLDTLSSVQTLDLSGYAPISNTNQVDSIFFVKQDATSQYVYYITYKNRVLVVEYDAANKKFRVVDLITKSPITAKVRIYWSRFAYPIQSDAPDGEVQELTVSDWTSIPSPPASNKPVANIRIWDIP
jgi:hypothetical protein